MSFLSPGYFKDFLFVFGVQHFDYDIPSPLFLYIYFPSDISTSWMCGLTSFVSFGKFPGIFKSLQYFNIQYFTSLQILLQKSLRIFVPNLFHVYWKKYPHLSVLMVLDNHAIILLHGITEIIHYLRWVPKLLNSFPKGKYNLSLFDLYLPVN